MEKITSFTVNHLDLEPGVYVSRKDAVGGETVTTFDLRLTAPNKEPVMNTAEIHTLEHLGATFLRNHGTFGDKVLYFGPMGCRTGFYLLLRGDYESADILPLLRELFLFTRDFRGEVPGAAARDCALLGARPERAEALPAPLSGVNLPFCKKTVRITRRFLCALVDNLC